MTFALRAHRNRYSLLLALAVGTAGCRDSTAPASCSDSTATATTLPIPGPPDFLARVSSNTHREFFAPSGYWVSQYEIWVAIPPSLSANAGVVVGAARPVFARSCGVLERVTPAAIAPGDAIQVWHDATVGYGSVQAPSGAPAYGGTQIVILRSGS